MKNLFDIYCLATNKFNPMFLSQHTKEHNGSIIVDKSEIIKSEEDFDLFITLLNQVYRWDYTTDYKNTTIYFEPSFKYIAGGAYDESAGRKCTWVAVASGLPGTPYIYSDRQLQTIVKNLQK